MRSTWKNLPVGVKEIEVFRITFSPLKHILSQQSSPNGEKEGD